LSLHDALPICRAAGVVVRRRRVVGEVQVTDGGGLAPGVGYVAREAAVLDEDRAVVELEAAERVVQVPGPGQVTTGRRAVFVPVRPRPHVRGLAHEADANGSAIVR